MPQIEKHAPGTFCWVELSTSVQNAAIKFYETLFGWTHSEFPMGPGDLYTIFQLNGRDVAAGYTLREAERANHIPPHWNLYVAVENADATAKKAQELGAQLPAGVFDVGGSGRMAVVIDPTGAAICLWQPNQSQGTGVMGENNAYCWADLITADRLKAKQFYESLFGWKIFPSKDKDDSSYLRIMSGDQGIGGIQPDEMRKPGVPPHWLPYFMTGDIDATTARGKELGAAIYAGPMKVDKSLSISVLADPQGAVFALFSNAQ